MTFLPIIARELRVAARKRSTFWMRVIVAIVAVVVGCVFLLLFRVGAVVSMNLGDTLFGLLSTMALVAVLSAGLFFTSDCLSEEKREGTLGFLFLTDLRGYDVAGGKLAASSLRVSFALLALFPVLALTLLVGAVSGGLVLKTAFALLNALFCSLAAGLAVSSASRDAQKALAGTLFLLLLWIFGGPVVDHSVTGMLHRSYRPVLSLTSPGYVFETAGAWGRNPFWLALAVTHLLAWGLLALASALAPRTWQERPSRKETGQRLSRWRYGGARRLGALRRRLMDHNPVQWLTSREQWQALAVWLVALAELTVLVGLWVGNGPQLIWMFWGWLNGLMTLLLYIWVAASGCRFHVEARRSGFLEGVLSTSLPVQKIVSGQWRAMLRLFGPPVVLWELVQLAAVIPVSHASLGLVAAAMPPGTSVPGLGTGLMFATTASGAVISLAGMATLAWFSMWMGLTTKNTGLATLKTILFVKVIPGFVISMVAALAAGLYIFPQVMKMAKSTPAVVAASAAATNAPALSPASVATNGLMVTNAAGTISPAPVMPAAFMQSMMVFPLVVGAVSMVLYLVMDAALIAWARKQLLSRLRENGQRGPVDYATPPRLPPPVPPPPVIGSAGSPGDAPQPST